MGKLQPERFETVFLSNNRRGFFFGNKIRDPLITYLLERDIQTALSRRQLSEALKGGVFRKICNRIGISDVSKTNTLCLS